MRIRKMFRIQRYIRLSREHRCGHQRGERQNHQDNSRHAEQGISAMPRPSSFRHHLCQPHSSPACLHPVLPPIRRICSRLFLSVISSLHHCITHPGATCFLSLPFRAPENPRLHPRHSYRFTQNNRLVCFTFLLTDSFSVSLPYRSSPTGRRYPSAQNGHMPPSACRSDVSGPAS